MKEFESFARIGTEPHRSHYIPFAETDTIRIKHGIQVRTSGSRFMSLDGVWQIRRHDHVDENGLLTVINESSVDIRCKIADTEAVVKAGSSIGLCVENVRPWTPEDPKLYTLHLLANGELIEEKIGFREVSIEGKVFKVNGVPVKLKGVNRHGYSDR